MGSKTTDFALLLLRAGIGLLLAGYHGFAKFKAATAFVFSGADWPMTAVIAQLGLPFPAVLAVCAAVAESVAALLLVAGLWTRYAAAIIVMNMAVAFYFHTRTDWRVEPALLYLLPALFFVFVPPGRFSLDALLTGRGSPRNKRM